MRLLLLPMVGALLALCLFGVGTLLLWGAWDSFALLHSGDAEAIDICRHHREMDCNPTYWRRFLLVGLGCVAAGTAVGLLVRRARASGASQ